LEPQIVKGKQMGGSMNTAQLVNLILEKLRRVEFVLICDQHIDLVWGYNKYRVFADNPVNVIAWNEWSQSWNRGDTIYTERVEAMLNGKVRNDAGELVQP
jgi:hypothetical protein